jgi:hypothetical protein
MLSAGEGLSVIRDRASLNLVLIKTAASAHIPIGRSPALGRPSFGGLQKSGDLGVLNDHQVSEVKDFIFDLQQSPSLLPMTRY